MITTLGCLAGYVCAFIGANLLVDRLLDHLANRG